jgi:hypothetical protein
LYNSEMTNILSQYNKGKDKKWLSKRISAVLSVAKSQGEIPNLTNVRMSNLRQDIVWGSKDWLDEKGNILHNHLSIQKEVKRTVKSI